MIERKDYESAIKQFEALIVNAEITLEGYKAALELYKLKIKEFPEEKKDDDPMPEEIKEVIKNA